MNNPLEKAYPVLVDVVVVVAVVVQEKCSSSDFILTVGLSILFLSAELSVGFSFFSPFETARQMRADYVAEVIRDCKETVTRLDGRLT